MERVMNIDTRNLLVSKEPMLIGHLIKFERPYRPDSTIGIASTSANRYAYFTDASIPISFDDGSTDLAGNSNGTQIYYPNKLKSIGNITETSQATTSSTNIVLDGTAIGTIAYSILTTIQQVSGNLYSITFSPDDFINILDYPIKEGDKILVNSVPVILTSFGTNNILVQKIDTNIPVGSNINTSIELASEELLSILLDKNSTEYSSFVNREVFIYRAYASSEGVIAGTPILLFKGIISSVSFDDGDNGIDVTWSLTNQWGDFSQVRGRLTSDESHRALDTNGAPQIDAAIKPIYAYDKGFSHSDTAINVVANYTTIQQVVHTKKKKNWLGMVSYKTWTTDELVLQDAKLNINTQSDYLPIVYGVRPVEGKIIFADVLKNDSSIVYAAYSLCEGEIGGIYDIYIDSNSLICTDKADYDARSGYVNAENISSYCYGRGDRGDVLSGSVATNNSSTINAYTATQGAATYSPSIIGSSNISSINLLLDTEISTYTEPDTGVSTISTQPSNNETYSESPQGLIHGTSLTITSPQDITIDVFAGTSSQHAAANLSTLAYNKAFKIQDSYWKGTDTYEYWGPNHRLLDTAYVVAKYTLTENATGIPSMDFLVKGKTIDCYNYDYSYKHDNRSSTESAANFNLGDVVTLYSDTGSIINSSVTIIDKWTIQLADGTKSTRFRFSTPPNIVGIKKFYMKNASNQTWTMITYDHLEASGTITSSIKSLINSVSLTSGAVSFNLASNTDILIKNGTVESSQGFGVVTSAGIVSNDAMQPFKYGIIRGTVTSTKFTSKYDSSALSAAQSCVGLYLGSFTSVKLPTNTSSVDNFYTNCIITVKRFNSVSGKLMVQTGKIVGYDGSTRIATIDTIWSFIPDSGDTFEIAQAYADSRISNNTAMQILDYISSPVYGMRFDINRDIELQSWLAAARKCDTKSDVTVRSTSSTESLVIGDTYRYPATGNVIFSGTVDSVLGNYVTFTNVIGKLTNKWNSWKSYKVNELVYYGDYLYVVTVAGTKTTEPTHTSGTVNGLLFINSLSLYKQSNISSTIPLVTTGNPVQSLLNGAIVSGYSIYDSDSIDYWRQVGWDEHAQRYATLYQTNISIDSSNPVFDNVNSMLSHCNGILRNTGGKWSLDIESKSDNISSTDIRYITLDDIIGKIELSDDGIKSSYNIVTASFADPANKFQDRNISFYNSIYQLADKNVQKKGSLSVTAITNYYNTRLLVDSFMHKSRFGLTVNLTMDYSGVLLVAGTVIALEVPKYKWFGKKFRISSIIYRYDGLVDITASEYDDSIYGAKYITKSLGSSGASNGSGAYSIPDTLVPYNITVSADKYEVCIVSWVNPPDAIKLGCKTEIWRAETNDINSAIYIGFTEPGVNQYTDTIVSPVNDGGSADTKYYWLRYRIE